MFSLNSAQRAVAIGFVGVTVACTDATIPTSPGSSAALQGPNALLESDGRGVFHRYVAIGTSVSMGWASDGAVFGSQEQAWPAQLARMAHREMTLPLIGGTGCRSPLQAPIASGVRISGEAAAADPSTLSCAPNVEGVELPTQNLALNAALVRDALYTTPENITDAANRATYPRVLPPGTTQIAALVAQNPKFVSVEFGANEVLDARRGIAVTGVTLFPLPAFASLYSTLVNKVADVTKQGLLVGLIRDVATFPGFRRGSELYADRATFAAAFNVVVSADCDGSDNLLFVPVRVPTAVATGLRMRALQAGPFTLSCAGGPPTTQDWVLTPGEAAVVNALMAQMNAHIASEANRLGFAHVELEALYGRGDLKPPFSVVQLMTSARPYGQYISLDGMHPNGEGQRVIAEAAADAVDARYQLGLVRPLVIAGR